MMNFPDGHNMQIDGLSAPILSAVANLNLDETEKNESNQNSENETPGETTNETDTNDSTSFFRPKISKELEILLNETSTSQNTTTFSQEKESPRVDAEGSPTKNNETNDILDNTDLSLILKNSKENEENVEKKEPKEHEEGVKDADESKKVNEQKEKDSDDDEKKEKNKSEKKNDEYDYYSDDDDNEEGKMVIETKDPRVLSMKSPFLNETAKESSLGALNDTTLDRLNETTTDETMYTSHEQSVAMNETMEHNSTTMNDTTLDETSMSMKEPILDILNHSIVKENNIPNDDKTSNDTNKPEDTTVFPSIYDTQDLVRTEVVVDQLGTSSSSPRIPESYHLNLGGLTALESEDDVGPTYTFSMPGNLHKVVYHSPDSLVCQVLASGCVTNLTKDEKQSLVQDLTKYIQLCSEKGMIYEASYVDSIRTRIREAPDYVSIKYERQRCNESLTYADDEIKEQTQFWDNQKKMIESEYNTSLKELEMRHKQQQDLLDQEWQSSLKTLKYSKPSPQLLDLRYKTKCLIASKQFERAKQNGALLIEMEKQEAQANTRRMEIAYKQADANLERKYRADCESLKMQRDNKLIAAQHASERAMKPVLRRREKLSSESTKLSSIESRGVEIRGQKIPQFKKDSNLPFVDLNAPPRLPIQKIRITREKKSSDTTSRSSLSSTRRKYSGSQRTNRSPSRLGQAYH